MFVFLMQTCLVQSRHCYNIACLCLRRTGDNALMIASSHGYSSIVHLLLAEYHANVNEQNMYVVLNYSLWYSRFFLDSHGVTRAAAVWDGMRCLTLHLEVSRPWRACCLSSASTTHTQQCKCSCVCCCYETSCPGIVHSLHSCGSIFTLIHAGMVILRFISLQRTATRLSLG